MQYRAKSSMDSDIEKVKKAHELLVESDSALSELVSSIRGDQFNWSGKNKEAVISLLDLCSELSKNLIPVAEKNCNSMEKFYEKASDFMSSSEIISPWR
ncbi:hypothetical protein [Clostridium cibarium]|uniref:WXG100 family type VII secretion target n=2 Tax=Clostridium TaxID=1485 RepID=A0ABR8PQW1_9CLOT|nr:hypothetical protein [Clostridium cibarium]MBD7910561.1 hypothetical protein [Clostridium cibarium]